MPAVRPVPRPSIDPVQSALLASLIKAHRRFLVALANEAGHDAEDVVQDVCLAVLEGRLEIGADRALRVLAAAVARGARRAR